MIDISSLTLTQLTDLKKQIDVEIIHRKEAEKQSLRTEMQRMAAAAGLSLTEIMDGAEKKIRKSGPTGIAKFTNPADASQTWTGRGRKPLWVIDCLAAGKTLDNLHI